MHVKFAITYEDDTTLESHDGPWNWVYDRVHALPPNNNKQWKEYALISDEGHEIHVNFHTGVFQIKQPNGELQPIYVQDKDGSLLTNRTEKQSFKNVTEPWQLLNGLEYFPAVGRRYVKGDWGELINFFCGWKIRFRDKKASERKVLQVTYHLDPLTGSIFPEIS